LTTDIHLSAFGEALGEAHPLGSSPDIGPRDIVDELCRDGHRDFRLSSREPWELASDSARHTLAQTPGRPDLVVYCTNTLRDGDDRTSGPATFLEALGLVSVQLIGVGMAGCGNVGAGLRVATAMLASGAATNALLVTTDVAPPGWRLVRGDIGVFSDGAASCAVSLIPTPGSLRLCGIDSGADWRMYTTIPGRGELAATRAMVTGLRRAIGPVLRHGATEPTRLTHPVTNNYRSVMLKLFSDTARVDPARVYAPTLADIAHCHSADTLINLSRLLPALSGDSLVLLLSTGTHSWTCALLEPSAV